MPIVASMGGNAGTQTLTVAVRALAAKELSAANAARILWKECVAASANGLIFAAAGFFVFLGLARRSSSDPGAPGSPASCPRAPQAHNPGRAGGLHPTSPA